MIIHLNGYLYPANASATYLVSTRIIYKITSRTSDNGDAIAIQRSKQNGCFKQSSELAAIDHKINCGMYYGGANSGSSRHARLFKNG